MKKPLNKLEFPLLLFGKNQKIKYLCFGEQFLIIASDRAVKKLLNRAKLRSCSGGKVASDRSIDLASPTCERFFLLAQEVIRGCVIKSLISETDSGEAVSNDAGLLFPWPAIQVNKI